MPPRIDGSEAPTLTSQKPLCPADVSIIVPVGGSAPAWPRCLDRLTRLDPAPGEIIAVIDGINDEHNQLASAAGFQVVSLQRPCGPAAARNRGAETATGDLLFFVDSDVELPTTVVDHLVDLFDRHTDVAALIGSYDADPGTPTFLSQYRNLLHHFVHQNANVEASTFWGACGAIRGSVFLEVGGFDEGYMTPSVEDIELGSRLRAVGHSIRLAKELQVKHLKQWRAKEMISTDLMRRAVPWTELMLRDGRLINDLNITTRDRAKVLLAWLFAAALLAGPIWPPLFGISLISVGIVGVLSSNVLRFFVDSRGLPFALMAVPWYVLYLLICGLGFAIGFVRHHVRRPPR